MILGIIISTFPGRGIVVATLLAAIAIPYAGAASSQQYPTKPVRIVTAQPGSGNDFASRLVAQGLTSALGQQVIVDNRSGDMPGELVAKAAPDGYTLLLYGNGVWLLPFLRDNVPWDPIKDFSPVIQVMYAPNVLVVHPAVPANSVQEFIALARAKPGQLNYGSGATGTSPHLTAELLNAMAGTQIVRINYRGTGPAITALLAGEVQMMFASTASVAPHVKSGRLRALAVTSTEPSVLAPGLPTMAASGLPGYEATSRWGIIAPAGTPAARIGLINREVGRILQTKKIADRLLSSGVEPAGGSPEAFARTVKSEMAKWGKVIRDRGIRAQ